MQREQLINLDGALTARLGDALLYPLRGQTLAALAMLAIGLLVAGVLPGIIGVIVWIVAWVGTYMYALGCLRRSADGWADPPELALEGSGGAAIALFVLQLLGLFATKLAYHLYQDIFLVPLTLALVLPSLTLSLAFGDGLLGALNPARIVRLAAVLGASYLIPVALGVAQSLVWIGALSYGHGLVASAFWLALTVYFVLLDFHVLGRLAYRFHEAMGMRPEADQVADDAGLHEDEQLLAHTRRLDNAGQRTQALELLQQRLRGASAPWAVHARLRELALAEGRHDAVLEMTPRCLASLVDQGDWRRALAVVNQNLGFEPTYFPDDMNVTGTLAEQAARMGMNRLALKLARGYVNRWQHDQDAPRYGLLAAQLLAQRLDHPTEAGVLASKLLLAFPDCPQRGDIETLLATLKQRQAPAHNP